MVEMRFGQVIVFLGIVNLFAGCSLLGQETIPDWVDGTSQEFPVERYLTGRGEAESRELAEQRAYGAVARIFSARVKARLVDSEVYSQVDQAGHDHMKTSRHLTLDHLTDVSSDKVLEDVQILDGWYRADDERYFALAGLDRRKTATKLLERIGELDNRIHQHSEDGRTGTEVLTRLRGFKRALRDSRLRAIANADLQIVNDTGQGVPVAHSPADIQRELNEYLLTDVRVEVRITGDQEEQVAQAVRDGLAREGFVTSEPKPAAATAEVDHQNVPVPNPALLVTGTARLDDLTLVDPLFTYVRWCCDLQISEPGGQRVIGVISRTGREGHITQHEARVRATQAMQEVVSTEIAKALARSIYDDRSIPSLSSSCPPRD